MSNNYLSKRISIFLVALISSHIFSYSSYSQDTISNEKCNLEDSSNLREIDYDALKRMEIKVLGESTEGGIAYLYEKEGVLHAINFVLLSETGRLEINYFFDSSDHKRYLVDMADYRYTAPIYYPSFKIASKSINMFVVCEDLKPNYPDSSDLDSDYSRATRELEIIRSSIKN